MWEQGNATQGPGVGGQGPGGTNTTQGPGEDKEAASEWVRQRLGFEPDAVQRRLLDTAADRVILNCTRQWGKSTTTAAKAVHHAYTKPESLTLVVSPSARQSGEFLRKAAGFARKLGMKVKGDGDNEMSVVFPNGSRLVGLPGNEATVRGFSAVSLLLVDEASRVSEDLYLAVRPMLAVSAGTMWLLSTPFGKRGFFWETWDRGGEEWERAQVTAGDTHLQLVEGTDLLGPSRGDGLVDGTHPNDLGFQWMAEGLGERLRKVLGL